MIDFVSPEQRSRMMAAVRGSNTAPELHVRRRLFGSGFRFRLHAASLPGKPDIVLKRYKTVVFVHGCFWHGHRCNRGKRPTTNMDFWNAKIDGNMRRDKSARAALKGTGWRCVVIWECKLERGTQALLDALRTEVQRRPARRKFLATTERAR